MPIPPNNVPDGKSAEDYNVLSALYTLMQRNDQALEATKRALLLKHSNPVDGASEHEPEDVQKAVEVGHKFAGDLLQLISSGGKDGAENVNESLNALMEIGRQSGGNDDQMAQLQTVLETLMAELTAEQKAPPREVPTSGMSAEEYYDLGVKYKTCGWTEQARDALRYAMELDPDGEVGQKALRFMRARLPRHPVPLAAEQENIRGFNEMVSGNYDAATKTFEQLLRTYPDFEWPQGNLGSICIHLGDFARAEEILINAVQINPFYNNGWAHLARANIIQSKYQQADYCLSKIAQNDPNDDSLEQLRSCLDQVQQWEQSGGSF
jgi:tetratricopeptide (TPR) repeat protein